MTETTEEKKLPSLTTAQRYAMEAYWQGRKPARGGQTLANLAKLGLIARTGKDGAYEPTEYARSCLARSGAHSWYVYGDGLHPADPEARVLQLQGLLREVLATEEAGVASLKQQGTEPAPARIRLIAKIRRTLIETGAVGG